jgi:hypothetical protein
MIVAATITTKRFGPSGSLKNKNIVLEQTIDAIAKISNEIFFEMRYIILIISKIVISELRYIIK